MSSDPGHFDVTEAVATLVACGSVPRDVCEPIVARAFLDTIGVIVAGRGERSTTAVADAHDLDVLEALTSRSGSSRPSDVALLLGTAAHCLDYDDYATGMGHPSAVLVPALLSLRRADTDPGDLIDAYTTAYEVWYHLGLHAQPSYDAGWHTTATVGTLAAACASARLLGLSTAQTRDVLGVAASMASGLLNAFGSDVKGLHAGLAAASGVRAATLVKHGLHGPADPLESEVGFLGVIMPDGAEAIRTRLRTLSMDPAHEPAVRHYAPVPKPYASCGATHAAIDAALALHEQLGSDLSAYDDMIITASIPSILYDKALQFTSATDGLEGKFCLEYCVAAALLHGSMGLSSFSDETVRSDRQAAQLATRVRRHRNPALDDAVRRGDLPAGVSIEVPSRSIAASVDIAHPLGSSPNPMSGADFGAKFTDAIDYAGALAPAPPSWWESALGMSDVLALTARIEERR